MTAANSAPGDPFYEWFVSVGPERFTSLVKFGKAEGALTKARARCVSVDLILERLAMDELPTYQERRLLFLPLIEATLTADQIRRLEHLIDSWDQRADQTSGRGGDGIYGLISTMMDVVSRDFRVLKSLAFLGHRHVRRRQVGARLLRSELLTAKDVGQICRAAEQRPDALTIRLIARHAAQLDVDDATRVALPRLNEDPYWQSRVMEALLDRVPYLTLQELAAAYPLAFLYALARNARNDLFDIVEAQLLTLEANLDWLPIVIFALGKLRRRAALDRLEQRMHTHLLWPSYVELGASRPEATPGLT